MNETAMAFNATDVAIPLTGTARQSLSFIGSLSAGIYWILQVLPTPELLGSHLYDIHVANFFIYLIQHQLLFQNEFHHLVSHIPIFTSATNNQVI